MGKSHRACPQIQVKFPGKAAVHHQMTTGASQVQISRRRNQLSCVAILHRFTSKSAYIQAAVLAHIQH